MKFLISLCLVISLYAKVIDKIAIIVNDIPITTYDIELAKQKYKNPINYLIDKAILKSAIREKGIYVDEFDIDKAMQEIARKNGMSLFNFKNYLLEKGQLDILTNQLKSDLEKRKLLETLNIRVTQNDIKEYYKTHKNQFTIPSKIDVTEYSSNNKKSLVEIINNPLANVTNVEVKNITFEANKTNPRLYRFIASNKTDSFTPIVNIGNYKTFYINKKYENQILPLNMVENQIYQTLMQQKSQIALNDFIAKLKAKANIKYLIPIN
jgi:hypothetical protein